MLFINPMLRAPCTELSALPSPSAAYAADKLVVKDSEGATKFVVTDEGKVGIVGIRSQFNKLPLSPF